MVYKREKCVVCSCSLGRADKIQASGPSCCISVADLGFTRWRALSLSQPDHRVCPPVAMGMSMPSLGNSGDTI